MFKETQEMSIDFGALKKARICGEVFKILTITWFENHSSKAVVAPEL